MSLSVARAKRRSGSSGSTQRSGGIRWKLDVSKRPLDKPCFGKVIPLINSRAYRMNKISLIAFSTTVLWIGGCATSLEPSAERIRMVTAEQKSACEALGLIVADQQLGPYKASNSMNKMLNEAARRGANAVYLVSQGQSGIDGVSVTAEALRCK